MARGAKFYEAAHDSIVPFLHRDEPIRGSFVAVSRIRHTLVVIPMCAWVLWLTLAGRDLEAFLLTLGTVVVVYVLSTRYYLFVITDRRVFVHRSGRGWPKRFATGWELPGGVEGLAFRERFHSTYVELGVDGRKVTAELTYGDRKRAGAALAAVANPPPAPAEASARA